MQVLHISSLSSCLDLEGHIHTAIKDTEKAVNDALVDLRALQNVTRRQLTDHQNGSVGRAAPWCTHTRSPESDFCIHF